MYQLRKKSKRRYWLNNHLAIFAMICSLAVAGQNDSVGKNTHWLNLIKQDPVEDPAQIDKLEDVVQVALRNSSQLKAQYAEWEMRKEQIGTVVTLPDPSLSVGYFIEPVETAQGPQTAKLSLGQTIPWVSKTKAAKQAKRAQADQAYEALRHTRIQLIQELGLLWAEIVYLQASQTILEQKVGLSSDLEAVLTTQYMSASISHQKYAEVQIQTLDLSEQLQSMRDREYRVRVDLSAILELDAPVVLKQVEPVPVADNPEQGGATQHPRLLRIDKLNQEAKAQQLKARADYVPDLRIGMDYILTDAKSIDGVEVAESGRNPLVFSFGFAVPVWNWSKKQSAVEASKWQEKRVEALRSREITLLKQEYESARSMLHENLRQIVLYEDDLLPKAREIVQVMEQAYISQSADIETFTRAQQKLLDLELKLAKANRSANIQNTILTYLRGE